MNTKTHMTDPSDAVLLAYGQMVRDLLSSSTAERWNEQLWAMFDGYILGLQELGHAPELHHTYFSFKELLEFFEHVEEIRVGDSSSGKK
ncbi:hypothetical protein [Dyadobacter aurulentus]|uniref:hypothetical protein n=1 Tax=Dyadobacter sp. UC 10 TaxID=2605428 RepID=UPI0011F11A02|nr:hypothetical protein [Dyadobacter sp. UC 10]KAA0991183.1 hypothetical protein FXO21_13940 [Dyadobacter sp. UC 10]